MRGDTIDNLALMKQLSRRTPSKIVLLVVDGIGGLPHPETGKTELETAATPNLDRLAAGGVCGLADPVAPGITPGSAPGHAALFGYDPLAIEIGRGVLEAVGIDFDLRPGDVAARGNFCTVDGAGLVTDRRAGRISTDKSSELCRRLDGFETGDVTVLVLPVREHRFVAVFRGDGLAPDVTGTDPQEIGVAPLPVEALSPVTDRTAAAKTASAANAFIGYARDALAGDEPANMVLLRGFSTRPVFDRIPDVYKLAAAAVTVYPMYRGLARLAGMDALEAGTTIADEIEALRRHWDGYDFFFVHVKGADSAGEDGDFERKVAVIEEVDRAVPALLELRPDVLVVTGDHSTPAKLRGHSWHPVPLLLAAETCRRDGVTAFAETDCISGGLGRFPAVRIMALAMAHAEKLAKFGA
ncbi:MAG: 2,3-bisphosphoglycerate-independent phosphoglycerate mutase [Dehalococcoidales bacterium]